MIWFTVSVSCPSGFWNTALSGSYIFTDRISMYMPDTSERASVCSLSECSRPNALLSSPCDCVILRSPPAMCLRLRRRALSEEGFLGDVHRLARGGEDLHRLRLVLGDCLQQPVRLDRARGLQPMDRRELLF